MLLREPAAEAAALSRAIEAALARGLSVAVHERCPGGRLAAEQTGVVLHLASGRLGERPPLPFAVSTHSEVEVDEALAAGAVYTLLSPVWSPSSKPDDRRPTLGLARFLTVAGRHRPLSVLALGGVTPERYRGLLAAGAGAAILGPLSGTDDEIRASIRQYRP